MNIEFHDDGDVAELARQDQAAEEIKIINEAFQTGDAAAIAHAVSTAAWARGLVDQAFTGHAAPTIKMLSEMLDVLGLELRVCRKNVPRHI